ncbi:PREDICTED: uncharacterized protein LOC104822272 isoform X2 [Tarenaya hassleriana]|uniref:uncharacterized protein LOC104822272 isoform X2 n=1 Tax=Tarenaya hassleriana TaxID=28532 RepID=UPI00053C4D9C|nr:PREDICTED: uncharacterized protein LOC104822272 isoform X2 [Tarenaya hassleriana]
MEGGGRRSREPLGVVMKKRSSSGCLIVKKKGDVVGGICSSSGNRPVYDSWLENKRSRTVMSDSGSGSSAEIMIPGWKTVHQTMHHHCNGLSGFDGVNAEERDSGRRRDWQGDSFVGKSSEEWKRNRLDEVGYNDDEESEDELMTMRMRRSFDGGGVDIGRKSYFRSAQFGIDKKGETGSSRDLVLEKRRKSYFDGSGAASFANQGCRNRFKVTADETEIHESLLRKKYMGDAGFDEPIRVQGKNGVLKVMINKKNKMSGLLRNFTNVEAKQTQTGSKIQDTGKIRVAIQSPTTLKGENLAIRSKMHMALAMKNKGLDQDSEDSDMSARVQKKNIRGHTSGQMSIAGGEKTLPDEPAPPKIKDGKVRRGSGTEKQRLRERIRGMLLEAGWMIDYRPRKNRDYLDAVYISPTGTAYWSIIKAYEALLKQFNNEETVVKPSRDFSSFTLISDETLSQLTRKTKRKVERDLKRQQQGGSDSDEKNIFARKFPTIKNEPVTEDRYVHKEKLSSSLGQGSMSMGNEVNHEAGLPGMKHKCEKSAGSSSHHRDGGKSVKTGRNTLLVRRSTKGNNSESDGFVHFSGKRTVLAWLIDNGIVQLDEKVMYMNPRDSRAMLEGWITRDGIHCGCCSKIISVSKFEIHAGSKLQQPFQNMYLDSGVSLLQCQIDAWARQKGDKHVGFCNVDINEDDPNDDACGICGDGGDLICCDGCPSTFHQRCLDIKMLPLGDWHCPNCTCKFCRTVVGDHTQTVDATLWKLLTCKMCEKKYHKPCMRDEMIATPTACAELGIAFCGVECKELCEGLQKYVGIKHELDNGFSWSLVHRADTDSDSSVPEPPQTVESHSKLSVALTVMDECFLPIIDRRSGVNIMHNVLYNCGSNFNWLNFGGFYTAILERDDEIIASASIRFRGDRLAEMPFIGTRHIYRRQGMCRRLFEAIKSTLQHLEIETLVIPATPDFSRAWIDKFGFRPVDDDLLKKEIRSMNLLVFPDMDMLQKDLLGQRHAGGDSAPDTGIKRELYGDGQEDCEEFNEDMDSAIIKTTREADGFGHSSHHLESSRSSSPSDSGAKRRTYGDPNSASRDVIGDTEVKPSGEGDEDTDSGYETTLDSPRREESLRGNREMAFLDQIIRSPVDG